MPTDLSNTIARVRSSKRSWRKEKQMPRQTARVGGSDVCSRPSFRSGHRAKQGAQRKRRLPTLLDIANVRSVQAPSGAGGRLVVRGHALTAMRRPGLRGAQCECVSLSSSAEFQDHRLAPWTTVGTRTHSTLRGSARGGFAVSTCPRRGVDALRIAIRVQRFQSSKLFRPNLSPPLQTARILISPEGTGRARGQRPLRLSGVDERGPPAASKEEAGRA